MEFLTIAQVAAQYDRSPSAARVWAQDGILPGAFKVKTGMKTGLWLVDADRLDGFKPPRRGRKSKKNLNGSP